MMFGGGGCFGGGYSGGGGYGGTDAGQGGPGGGVQASQGGFLPEPAGPAGGNLPEGPGKTAAQTLTPVTIRMLLDAVSTGGQMGPDGAFRVNGGKDLQMLTLVACVEAMQNQTMNIQLTLNDGTGKIRCNMYFEGDPATGGPDFQEGDYIRVFGHLRQWDQQDGITAHRILKVESANEIAYHTIEVAHVHLSVTGKLVKSTAAAGQANRMPTLPTQQGAGAANRYAAGGAGNGEFPPQAAQPAHTAPYGAAPQAARMQPPTFQQSLAGGAAPMQGSVPQMPPPQAAYGQMSYQQPQQHMQPPQQQVQMQASPQMQVGFGGVPGAAAQARTSPFQGGPGQYQHPNMPPPGGSPFGGAGGNSLYGMATNPASFR